MKYISKVIFCILCINILGASIQTNAVIQVEETGVTQSEGTSYNVEEFREFKSLETKTISPLMAAETALTTGDELIINAIATGIKNKQTEIDLTPYVAYMVDSDYTFNLYFKTMHKFPELFYTSLTYVGASSFSNLDGKITEFTLKVTYTVDISKIDSMIQAYNNKLNEIRTNYINPSYGELKNEYIVNDYILENCTYDNREFEPDISHTAYGALVNGIAVCDGYAKAVKQLLNDCGIESELVINNAKDHAWNYVNIEGQYYHLDVTWNDPVPETNESNYRYFNLSDTGLSTVSNHDIPASVYPTATSDSFDFLRNNYNSNGNYSKKIGDKLYYTDRALGDLRSMDLNGANDTLVSSGLDFFDFEGYKSKLYTYDSITDSEGITNWIVRSYNLVSEDLKIEYVSDTKINDIYKKNSDLMIGTEGGNIDSLSMDMKEDVNGDGVINIVDVAKVAESYNKLENSIGYSSIKDVNRDGIIDIYDITRISMEI